MTRRCEDGAKATRGTGVSGIELFGSNVVEEDGVHVDIAKRHGASEIEFDDVLKTKTRMSQHYSGTAMMNSNINATLLPQEEGNAMFSESVENHMGCSQYILYPIVRAVLPPLNAKRVDEMVAEENIKGEMNVPHYFGRNWKITLMENAKCRTHILFPLASDGAFDVLIFYLHGGAYVGNFHNPLHFEGTTRVAAALTKCALFLVEYPLAPKMDHASIFDVVEGLYVQVTQRYAEKKIVVMGDSAGGGIALILTQRLAAGKRGGNVSLRQPDSVILQSPWLDVGVSAPESVMLEKVDPILRVDGLRRAGALLANGIDLSDPRVSPIYGSLEDLPPVSTWIGSYDCLLADSQRLRDRYKEEKIPTRFRFREKTGLLHCYFLLTLPGSQETIDEVVAAIIADVDLDRPVSLPIKSVMCGLF